MMYKLKGEREDRERERGREGDMATMSARAMSKAIVGLFATVPSPCLLSSSSSASPSLSFPRQRSSFRLHGLFAPTFPTLCTSSSLSSAPPSADAASPSASSHPSQSDDAAAAGLEVDSLDIRVGKVVKAWKHPEADSLYVEEVDIGESTGPRTICSGLVNYLSLEELQDRAVVVLANLKARNMRGVKSNGMLLATSDASHSNVELLIPPEGSVLGERVWFGNEADRLRQNSPALPNQVQKKKIWETVQPELKVNDEGFATFQEKYMRTSGGVVTSKSLRCGNIS
ncbi:hypothetical protein O6H91_10G006300 [Diphasiastrum complanatum]|uniref:Uncharacterized protein n=1 Tax=Diphasiastrum complanatum TaxID=34168 RepID=A0ACC2CE48_DIPCM|nr:hypothetical protein O6H91_Y425400 [Diphasiastrum complanatum]KAJ7540232.1 hypothetical protein O6H91_10G006300 [Diphasiastrum complanatum]